MFCKLELIFFLHKVTISSLIQIVHRILSDLQSVIGLHCDNSCGQNIWSVVAYVGWHAIYGLNTAIELCFMSVRHTRCYVDGEFDFLKQKY